MDTGEEELEAPREELDVQLLAPGSLPSSYAIIAYLCCLIGHNASPYKTELYEDNKLKWANVLPCF